MRSLLAAIAAVGFLAVPSLGVINVKLTADKAILDPGETTTVRIWCQGTAAGIHAMGGSISATGPSVLASNAGSFVWLEPFVEGNPYHNAVYGISAPNGGWSNFGSEQWTYFSPPGYYAKDNYEEFANYTVTAQVTGAGQAALQFASKSVSGYRPIEFDGTTTMGDIIPVTITVTPEPATMALLTLAGLLIGRRRI